MQLGRIKGILQPHKVKNLYGKYENHISSLALILGFTFDSLSLSGADALFDRVMLTAYISIAGLCIIIMSIYDAKLLQESVKGKVNFWFTLVMQFALGGLFSAFLIFYSRSSTLESSWPFLLLLVVYLLGNEIWKKHYDKFSFKVGVYFFALFSYFTITTPIFLNSIGSHVFVISSVISVFVFVLFISVIGILSRDILVSNKNIIAAYTMSIMVVINVFYFTNLIPPLPLVLKDSGVYHNLLSTEGGGYTAEIEDSSGIIDFISSQKVFHRFSAEPVYVITAVYSPIDLNINVIHNWQKFDEKSGKWITQNNITVPVKGGRRDGYRLYSFKNNVSDGRWRVNILTENNRIIGRIKFEIINTDYPPITTKVIK